MEKQQVTMGRVETLLGIIYIFVQLLFLPVILLTWNALLPKPLNYAVLNFINFTLNFIAISAIFHRYLIGSFQVILTGVGKFFKYYGLGFLFYWLCTISVNILILILDPEFSNINDDTIDVISKDNFGLMVIGTVLLVPIVEEVLYRGVIFGQLLRKNAVLAYILSVVIFSSIHVLGYIGNYPPFRLVLCFLQYIPASVFLAWAYQKSGTIWTSILIHTTVNFLGMMAMR